MIILFNLKAAPKFCFGNFLVKHKNIVRIFASLAAFISHIDIYHLYNNSAWYGIEVTGGQLSWIMMSVHYVHTCFDVLT